MGQRAAAAAPADLAASWAPVDKLNAELVRVRARLAAIDACEEVADLTRPDPSGDPMGETLALVLRWRAQRRAALASKAAGQVPKPVPVARSQRREEL